MTLTKDHLAKLGAIMTNAEVNEQFADEEMAIAAQGVQAGLVLALEIILTGAQFLTLREQWEIDSIKLEQYRDIAGVGRDDDDTEETTIEI